MSLYEDVLKLKAEIDYESNVIFCNRFLQLTGLKIGDEVICRFRSAYGTSKQSFGSSKDCPGIIKQHENLTVYVESIDKITQSYNASNNRSGRDRRSCAAGLC